MGKMNFKEFKEKYSDEAVRLIEQYRKNPTLCLKKTMHNEFFVVAV